jgi:hypothetical protein
MIYFCRTILHKHVYLFLFVFGVSTIFVSILTLGWSQTWTTLKVNSMKPYFADLRSIQGSIVSSQQGLNPQESNPGDPWERKLNYPLVWFEIAKFLRLTNEVYFFIFGAFILILFLLSCMTILIKYPNVFLFISLFSGSTLLAIERGNNDLFIFSLLFASIFLKQNFQIGLVLIAITLKIYPVFSIINLLLVKKKWIVFLLMLSIIFLFLSPQLKYISEGNTAGGFHSYGLKISLEIFMDFRTRFSDEFMNSNKAYFDIFLLILSVVTMVCILPHRKAIFKVFTIRYTGVKAQSLESRMFLAGASIYCGTFLFSSNFDYRLIFLLMCFAFLQTIDKFIYNKFLPISIILSMNLPILDSIPTKYGSWIGQFINLFSKNLVFVFLLILIFQLMPKVKNVVRFHLH